MSEISRRRFLGVSLLTGLSGACGKIFQPPPLSDLSSQPYTKTLEAYLDTLIPADETPGATQLGVAEKIIAKATENRRYRQLIEKGCHWLDEQARRSGADSFAALSEDNRERVVSSAAAGKGGPLPLIFLGETREDAFFHYYARPESWRGLGYAGPPQPRGFMNYAEAPKR